MDSEHDIQALTIEGLEEQLADALEEARINTGLAARQLVENSKLRAENARLKQQLQAESTAYYLLRDERDSLADELAEALYNLHLMTKQADAFYSENAQLREMVRKLRITTVARVYSGEPVDCEGDGSGPGCCEHAALWEVQTMDDSGSHHSYLCADHLSDYQKWAHGDGRLPMMFELDDSE
jgi:hypothetical protein